MVQFDRQELVTALQAVAKTPRTSAELSQLLFPGSSTSTTRTGVLVAKMVVSKLIQPVVAGSDHTRPVYEITEEGLRELRRRTYN